MDRSQFSGSLQSFVAGSSRRTILRGLAATLGLLDTRLPSAVTARARKRKRRRKQCKACGACQLCQKGKCKPRPDGTTCGSGLVCKEEACVCPSECCADADCGGACHACRNGVCVMTPGAACGNAGTCLSNGSCALICDLPGSPPCPSGCTCVGSIEGPRQCLPNDTSDCPTPQPCTSTAECPPGQICHFLECFGTLEHHCAPLCPI
jgi:hypothetical protein